MSAAPPAPTISVVVPTYNRGHLLAATLESVLAQCDCPPYEVLVVDDGSSDETTAVLERLDARVRALRLPHNGGVARARAAGVAQARGTLLAFHDSDDLMLPGRLGRLAAFLDGHPAVGAVFASGLIDRDGAPTADRVVPAPLARMLDGRSFGVREVLRDGLPVFLQAALIRRAAFEAAGGIDVSLTRHADLELACRLALVGQAVFLDVPVFRYRLHDGNQTRDRLKLREGMVAVMRRLREHHPDAIAQLDPAWFRRRERAHLYRIAWRHWMSAWLEARPRELVVAGSALRQALGLQLYGLPVRRGEGRR